MKRVFTLASWCVALAAVFPVCSPADAQDIKGSIRHTSQAIVIDGNPDDAAWATANEYTITGASFTATGEMPDDDADLSCTWKALWDDENLYFYAVVTDEYISNDGPDAWQDDSFELYIDAEARGKGDEPAVVDYNTDKEHPVFQLTMLPGEIEIANGINHERWVTNNGESSMLNAMAATSDTGYSIEWAIPWSTLTEEGTNPADILERGFFGFGMAINDDDEAAGERQGQLSWGSPSAEQWHLAADFPDVELLFPEGPGPDIFVKSAIDLGRVDAGAAVSFDLEVGNVGQTNTLTISGLSVTGPDKDLVTLGQLASVAPGEVGKLAVTLDTAGRTGAFDFTVEIQSDDVDAEDQTRGTRVTASVINFAGPAVHYAMDDEAGGTELRDVTGYNRHGTLQNGAALGGAALASGGSLNVSNGAQGVLPGQSLGALTAFTISMWIQPSALTELQTLIGQGVVTPEFAILIQDGDLNWFSDGAPEFGAAGVIAAGTKYHVVASYSNAQAVLYIDGAAVATQDSPAEVSIDSLENYYIGAFDGGLAFSGLIDDVQIYDRVISADDVAELFATPGAVLGGASGPVGPQPEPGAVVLGTDEASGFVTGGAAAAGPAGLSASYWLLDPKAIPAAATDDPLHREGDGGDNSGFADGTYATAPAGTFKATTFNYTGNDLTPVTEWLGADGASFEGTGGIIGDGLFRFEGYLYAEKAGNQQFTFTSDDGSVLYVANQLVIDNDGGHGDTEVSGTVFFPEPGFYPVDVRYFNGDWTDDAGAHGGANFVTSGLTNTVQSVSEPSGIAGLIGYWPLKGNASEASGQGTDGVLFEANGAWVEDATLGRLVYNSVETSHIALGNLPAITLDSGFTWSFWTNAGENPANDIVLGNRYMADGQDFAPREFLKFTPSKFEWHVDGAGQNLDAPATTPLPVGVWSHNLVVKNGDALTYYRDGVEIASSTITSSPANPQPLFLGGQPRGGATVEGYVGLFAEVAVFDRALNPDEVTDVYNRGLNGVSLGGGNGMTGGDLSGLVGVGFTADGAFSLTLPDGVTADVEFSTDLLSWETISSGATGPYNDTDATRLANPAGYYRAKQ